MTRSRFPKQALELLMNQADSTFSDTTHIELALGWHIINTKTGDRLNWHNGETGGYKSSMAIDTEKKNAVIILSNVSGLSVQSANLDALCFQLINTL